ncbi:MAG TPA: hypothetical protein VKZ63_06775, partial [Kofleriaceae bacterium]|nr:hypothetical protein [Kofleriaceae bacterium]
EAADKPAPEPAAAGDAAPSAADQQAAEEAKAREEEAKRAKEALAKAEADAAEEAKRWTDDLKKKAAALAKKKFPSAKAALTAILASEHRVPGNSDRDQYRHPVETLTFFGIKPNMTVVEVGSGAGWYTEVLAPLLARDGKLIAVSYDPDGPTDRMVTVYGKRLQLFLQKSPELYGNVQQVAIDPPDKLELGEPGSADMAVAIREMHGWQRRGHMDAYLAAIHAVLKDGGVFGVVQHRAKPDAVAEESAEKGYLPEQWLIDKVESAGFKLAEKSEVNANPKDTKDYEKGVWTLPPNFREGDVDREKYAAIGESDRMTLKFVKVARPAGGAGGEGAAGEEAAGEETAGEQN